MAGTRRAPSICCISVAKSGGSVPAMPWALGPSKMMLMSMMLLLLMLMPVMPVMMMMMMMMMMVMIRRHG